MTTPGTVLDYLILFNTPPPQINIFYRNMITIPVGIFLYLVGSLILTPDAHYMKSICSIIASLGKPPLTPLALTLNHVL